MRARKNVFSNNLVNIRRALNLNIKVSKALGVSAPIFVYPPEIRVSVRVEEPNTIKRHVFYRGSCIRLQDGVP